MNREIDGRIVLEKKLRVTTSPWERLPILLELALPPAYSNPDFAWRCAQEALTLGRELNDQFWIAYSLRAMGQQLMTRARYSEALYHLQQASDIFNRINDLRMKVQADMPIAMVKIFMGKFNEAMELLMNILPVFRSINNQRGIVHVFQYIGHIYKSIGDHRKALEHYHQALDMALQLQMEQTPAYLYQDLAFVYRNIGDSQRWEKYLFKSLAAQNRLGNLEGQAVATANIASMFLEQQRYSRAEKYVRRSGTLSRRLGFTAEEAMAWGQLGAISWYGGDFVKARRYYRKGLTLVRKSEHKVFRGSLYEHFGIVYLEAGKPEKAVVYLNKALHIISESGYTQYVSDVHEHLASAYEKLGDAPKALEHHKEYVRLREEYVNTGKVLEAGRVDMEKSMQKLANRLKNQEAVNTTLRKTLEQKEAELVALTLRLVQEGNRKGQKPRTKDCAYPAITSKQTDSWDAFARQFHKVHHNFYADLIKRYPQLTPTEVKVCSLIRIGLSSKEIASILDVSKRTVDSHREHIHKKLNISSRLAAFITSM